ncbi:protein chibby 1 [Crotalus adamanteus]|uniref:Mitochondrial import receptor subunit TOM22 homolog n=4 Tax=Serpentes TaxID=8570 RepID=A0AAW1BDT5_CROAD
MPLFGNTFSPKKTPPRKSASLSNLHSLDRSTREIELGLEYGTPVMTLTGQSLKFENGQWITESFGSSGDRRETQRLRKRNQQLEEENNLLRLKVDLLLDMLSETTAESHLMEKELEELKNYSRRRKSLSRQNLLLYPLLSFSLTVMAALTPLSPEDLLPAKGGAGKTEELEEDTEEEEDELDETLTERLWGLTEMFPEGLRSAAGTTFDVSLSVAQKMYRFSRAALWIGTTSFMILVLPVVFETEKLQMEQQQQLQQRQILLGPNTGLSGGMSGALPSLPGKI